jgi:hypothetical protein
MSYGTFKTDSVSDSMSRKDNSSVEKTPHKNLQAPDGAE